METILNPSAWQTLGLLLGGYIIHVLLETAERDKATSDRLTPLDVIWSDDSRWYTLATVLFLAVAAFGGLAESLLAMCDITVEATSGKALIYMSAGWNVDSLIAKLASVSKTKPVV